MKESFNDLRIVFLEFFKDKKLQNGLLYGDPCSSNTNFCNVDGANGDWVYAVFQGENYGGCLHYELIREGDGFVYVEFHVELASRNVRDWNLLRAKLDSNKRNLIHVSRYSSNYWKMRRPIQSAVEVGKDLKLLWGILASDGLQSDGLPSMENAVEKYRLPCQVSPQDIADMLEKGELVLPAVQRGKVWNAARCAMLWDSILRKFSIGTFSVQRNADRKLDLLDGQQRSTAISLGYAKYPLVSGENKLSDERNKVAYKQSLLWIDLSPSEKDVDQSEYCFYVTTLSQPWGYSRTVDETKNDLLTASERRASLENLEWHCEDEKPYPCELYPYKANMPVPYTLIREYLESCNKDPQLKCDLDGFVCWCKKMCDENTIKCKNWLRHFECLKNDSNRDDLCKVWKRICEATRSLPEYPIILVDAGQVADQEVGLYFMRIGKGGVRPDDEELAYSVLKASLGPDFRNVIEGGDESIFSTYGLAQPSRIAQLAVRCYLSRENQGHFQGADVLGDALKMCRVTGSDLSDARRVGTSSRDLFLKFVKEEFAGLVKKVDEKVFGDNGLTYWHRTRYCQYHNGDVYLFLLLAVDKKFKHMSELENGNVNLAGVAELVYGYAQNPDRAIRYMLSDGIRIGLARSMGEEYRHAARFEIPLSPKCLKNAAVEFEKIGEGEMVKLAKWQADYARELQMISEGYGNSPRQRAYGILLYACKDAKREGGPWSMFKYNPYEGVWSEDNCPWDYDHILPRSWVEKLSDGNQDVEMCRRIVNSIGNLAPLPFSLNRSLSDGERNSNYPFVRDEDVRDEDVRNVQDAFKLNGIAISQMTKEVGFPRKARMVFLKETINRFVLLYQKWYEGLGIAQILMFQTNEHDCKNDFAGKRLERHRNLSLLLESMKERGYTCKYLDFDGIEREIGKVNDVSWDWYVWDWLSLSKDVNGLGAAISLTICLDFSVCEIGLRKLSTSKTTTVTTYKALSEKLKSLVEGQKFEESDYESCSNNDFWYLCREVRNQNATNEQLLELLKELDGWAGKMKVENVENDRTSI